MLYNQSFLFNFNEFDRNYSGKTYSRNHDKVATRMTSVPGKISLTNSNDLDELLNYQLHMTVEMLVMMFVVMFEMFHYTVETGTTYESVAALRLHIRIDL